MHALESRVCGRHGRYADIVVDVCVHASDAEYFRIRFYRRLIDIADIHGGHHPVF